MLICPKKIINMNIFYVSRLLFTQQKVNLVNKIKHQFIKYQDKQKIPIRLPFIEQNHIHLNEILQLTKKSKTQLDLISKTYLETLKVNFGTNEKYFNFSQKYNQDLYSYIKKNILVENGNEIFGQESNFIKHAHYYFNKQGKKVRPLMIKLLENCLIDKFNVQNQKIVQQNSKKWAALIEILHIASLAHDDIIDDSPSRRGQMSQHLMYGKRAAVFSGNYIISKASKQIYEFKQPRLFQIYSVAMDNLATGQIIQALTKNRVSSDQDSLLPIIQNYMNKTYYKTAALMANAMRAVPLICNPQNPQFELESFRVGQHLGIAFQIIDDILDYISTQEQMGKQQVADIRQGNVTAPVYFALYQSKQSKPMNQIIKDLKRKNKSKQQALQIKKWIHQGNGLELSYLLAYKHIQTGLNYLKQIGVSEKQIGPWKYLAYKLLIRRK